MRIDNFSAPSTRRTVSSSEERKSLWYKPKKLAGTKKEMLFSEFHSLLSSGIDFNRAFGMLIRAGKDKQIRSLLEELHRNVVNGDTLWHALVKNGHFSNLDCGVVRIGEETGKLYESLEFLSEYYHKRTAQRRMISGAVSYPMIILTVAVVVLIFMVLVIVPMFEQVYARMGGELPGMTRAVIIFSRNFKVYLLAFMAIMAASVLLLTAYRNNENLQKWKAGILLRLPVAGELLKKHYQSHFCKLMHLLYGSGVPLLRGVEMLKGIVTFYPYRKSFDTITAGLNNGESFSENVSRYNKLYDVKLTTLLKVGEETNTLSQMLCKQGDDLAAELEHKLKQMGHILEPLLILFVGILVAIVLISMYLPMFKLGNTIH